MNSADNAPDCSSSGADTQPTALRAYRLPPGKIVRRAREWYLYDQDGTRYVDFWQADGAAFLGHRPDGYARLAKAEIDRGLWNAVPTPWPARLERALAELSATVQPENPPRLEVVNGQRAAQRHIATRWLPTGAAPQGALWHVVLPAPGIVSPPGSRLTELSALHAALLTRATYNLRSYLSAPSADLRGRIALESALPPGYTRQGAWLVPEARNTGRREPGFEAAARLARWRDIADRALAARIILPPDPWTPIAFPGELSPTDQKLWKKVCNEWPQ